MLRSLGVHSDVGAHRIGRAAGPFRQGVQFPGEFRIPLGGFDDGVRDPPYGLLAYGAGLRLLFQRCQRVVIAQLRVYEIGQNCEVGAEILKGFGVHVTVGQAGPERQIIGYRTGCRNYPRHPYLRLFG
ncbi:hypothetical protein [Actinomadura craniellae]|uniref:hypothetical protein n=1 Tax=Actinomadura craniellae TaxID=2231787 RepID=UPI0011BE1B18|nr:hypothetical protein [Actinomadura craniellae]